MFENNQEEIIVRIEQHAKKSFPSECCGLVIRTQTGFDYIECINTSLTPQRSFKISDRVMIKYFNSIEYIVHSHVNGSPLPSESDIKMSEEIMKSLFIISYPTMEVSGYTPNSIKQDIVGRDFFYGVNDCVNIVEDYYDNNTDYTHEQMIRPPYGWWLEKNDDTNFVMHQMFQKMGFHVVDKPEDEDIALIQFPEIAPAHLGVYINGHIIHNTINGKSTKEIYNAILRRYTVDFYRRNQ